MFNVDMTRVREKILFLITTRSTGQVVSIRQPRQRSVDWRNTFPSLRFRKLPHMPRKLKSSQASREKRRSQGFIDILIIALLSP